MSRRRRLMQILAVSLVLVGICIANLMGFKGLWAPGNLSDSQIHDKFMEDWRSYDRLWLSDRIPRKFLGYWGAFWEYTDVKQARVHGWPFTWLYCDVLMPLIPPELMPLIPTEMPSDGGMRSTAWPFDSARRFQVRWDKLAWNAAFACAMLWATFSLIGRAVGRARLFQFSLTTLLAAVTATALWIHLWIDIQPFYQGWLVAETALFVRHSVHLEYAAHVGYRIAQVATFIGMLCIVSIVFNATCHRLFNRSKSTTADVVEQDPARRVPLSQT